MSDIEICDLCAESNHLVEALGSSKTYVRIKENANKNLSISAELKFFIGERNIDICKSHVQELQQTFTAILCSKWKVKLSTEDLAEN